MIKKFFSYLFPISVHKQKSLVSKSINVVLFEGRLILDTPNTNYSYGSLQRILRFGLQKIGFANVQQMRHILVLGLAGGSVVKTLINEIGYNGKITAVDIDSEIVEIAKKYFNLDEINNLNIVVDDAQNFVQKTKSVYDLIIIDVFQDDVMPEFLFLPEFIEKVLSLLTSGGKILFNTMKINKLQEQRNAFFVKHCQKTHRVEIFPNVEGNNELIIVFP